MCPWRATTSVAAMKKIWVPNSIIISRWMARKHLIDSQPPVVWGWTCGRKRWRGSTLCDTQLIGGHRDVTWQGQLSRPRQVTACYWKASLEDGPPFLTAELFMISAQQCSPVHTLQIYHWWPCYITCTSAVCRTNVQIKDHLQTNAISNALHCHNLIAFNYFWVIWS